jgi:hypothetical protein
MTSFRSKRSRLFELQVTIVAIAVGIVTVSSVLATESRMLKRLHAHSRTTAPAAAAAAQR